MPITKPAGPCLSIVAYQQHFLFSRLTVKSYAFWLEYRLGSQFCYPNAAHVPCSIYKIQQCSLICEDWFNGAKSYNVLKQSWQL